MADAQALSAAHVAVGVLFFLYMVVLLASIPGSDWLADLYRGCSPLTQGIDRGADLKTASRCGVNSLLRQNGYDEHNRQPLTVEALEKLLWPRSRIDVPANSKFKPKLDSASLHDLPLLKVSIVQPTDQQLVLDTTLRLEVSGSLLVSDSKSSPSPTMRARLTVLVDSGSSYFPEQLFTLPLDPDDATVTVAGRLEGLSNGLHRVEVEVTLIDVAADRLDALSAAGLRNVTVAKSSVFYLFDETRPEAMSVLLEESVNTDNIPEASRGTSIGSAQPNGVVKEIDDSSSARVSLQLLRIASPRAEETVGGSVNVTIQGQGGLAKSLRVGDRLFFLLSFDGEDHDVTEVWARPDEEGEEGAGSTSGADGVFRIEVHGVTPGYHTLTISARIIPQVSSLISADGTSESESASVHDILNRGREVGSDSVRIFGPET